jgi:hypothetical protein
MLRAIRRLESAEAMSKVLLVGAAQLFYTLPPEVQRVWGIDPSNKAAIEAHTDALVRLVVR